MQQHRVGIIELLHRVWHRRRGSRPVLLTFWPQDYRYGACYQIDGRYYRITRYFHAAEYRFYEVWGREVHTPSPDELATPRPGGTQPEPRN